MKCLVIIVSSCVVLSEWQGRSDVVTEWNQLLMDAARRENTGPTMASRDAAIVHAAMYDAINSILEKYEPYRLKITPASHASAEAAGLAAAYSSLSILFPSQRAIFDAAYAAAIEKINDDRDEGIRIGNEIGRSMTSLREADGASTDVPYIPSDKPGAWRRTPPDFRPPLAANWGYVEPFVIPSTDAFPVPPPPTLDSEEYAEAYAQVKGLGQRVSEGRTANQTQAGIFWAYDRGGMGPPPILYNQIVRVIAEQQGNSLIENARLFALVNLTQADACIVCWKAKYDYNFWRPTTAIQEGEFDENVETKGDPNWMPLGAPGSGVRPDFTPPFPSYPSGHGTFGAAVFRLLQHFYGTDQIAFTCGSDEMPGVKRTFKSFSEADEENALSRVYLGVHWIFDQRVGQLSGREIADYAFQSALRPLPQSLEISVPTRLPNGTFSIHVSSPSGKQCSLKASSDLKDWTVLVSDHPPFNFIEEIGTNPRRFYLAVEE